MPAALAQVNGSASVISWCWLAEAKQDALVIFAASLAARVITGDGEYRAASNTHSLHGIVEITDGEPHLDLARTSRRKGVDSAAFTFKAVVGFRSPFR